VFECMIIPGVAQIRYIITTVSHIMGAIIKTILLFQAGIKCKA